MQNSATPVELRKHPRARLGLPARIRWLGPLGMRLEVRHTIDVSREGLLFRRDEPCEPRARVWVAFPFDAAAATFVQTETPARIARVEASADGGFYVGLHLELPRPSPPPAGQERRKSSRLHFALPIFVRPSGTPWPEESMTQDVSPDGARFETLHTYTAGQTVLAQIPWGEWAKAGQIMGRVLRVEVFKDAPGAAPIANSGADARLVLASVAVQWISSGRNLDAERPLRRASS
ncbi:MAG: PilZ domain-containing protein [Candidatus Acidiferrales bacterium]|jgi:hypothetical protein